MIEVHGLMNLATSAVWTINDALGDMNTRDIHILDAVGLSHKFRKSLIKNLKRFCDINNRAAARYSNPGGLAAMR